MLKVLMSADTIGGVWTYALGLARELHGLGVEVVLATMGRPLSREQREAASGLPALEIHESRFRLEWMRDPWRDAREAGEWLLKLAEETRPDVVHLNHYCHAHLPWNRPKLVVAHSDVYSWYHSVHGRSPGSEWKRYHEEVRRGLLAADLIVAPSAATIEDLVRSYGALARTRVIPNGRDLGFYREREKEDFIFTVGRIWDEAKNIRALDAVAPDLRVPVLAAGSDRSPDEESEGKRRALNRVLALGELLPEDLADYYSRAAIYALPATYEPFGLSVLEAAASGCALVLGDIPSLRENWDNAALFVNPHDTEGLRGALARLLQQEDDSQRRKLAKLARERSRNFSIQRMGAAYLREYQTLCAS